MLVTVQLLATHVIPPLAAFSAVFAILALVAWHRPRRWLAVLVGVVVVVYLAGSIPFLAANLAHPGSPGSFLAEVAVVITSVVALIGVVGEIRGTVTTVTRRRVVLGAVGAAAIAVLVSVVASLGVDSASRGADDVAIEAIRSTFPTEVTVPAGPSTLWFDNQDPFHHTVVIDGPSLREVLPASTAVRVDVDLAPGTYRYWCDVPGHETMEEVLQVD